MHCEGLGGTGQGTGAAQEARKGVLARPRGVQEVSKRGTGALLRGTGGTLARHWGILARHWGTLARHWGTWARHWGTWATKKVPGGLDLPSLTEI